MNVQQMKNESIAIFMELRKGPLDPKETRWKNDWFGPVLRYTRLEYHSSWDWLMPVIEKIGEYTYEDKGYDPENDKVSLAFKDSAYPRTFGMKNGAGKFMFRFNRQQLFYGETLIEAAYDACVDFITWYNTKT